MIVDRYREDFLCAVLPDDVLIQDLLDLRRFGQLNFRG